MARTVVPCVTSTGTAALPAPASPAPGRSCGATWRSRSTKEDPGSSPGPKVGRGDSTRRAYTGAFTGPSVAIGALPRPRATVGIVDGSRDEAGPPRVPARHVLGLVHARVSGGPVAGAAALVPLVERVRRGRERGEPRVRIHEVGVAGRRRPPQVLTPELESGVARETTRAVARSRRVTWLALVVDVVDDGARELGVVGPRAPVHVVGSDHHPDVVDDAHLGVDVDARPRVVLEVADQHPVATGSPQDRHGDLPFDTCGRARDASVTVGEPGYHDDHPQPWLCREHLRQCSCRALRPEELVLDVHQPARPGQRL